MSNARGAVSVRSKLSCQKNVLRGTGLLGPLTCCMAGAYACIFRPGNPNRKYQRKPRRDPGRIARNCQGTQMARTHALVVVALCSALNIVLGSIVYLTKAPLYADMVGTLLCCLLMSDKPKRAFFLAAVSGVISFVLGGVLINPFLPCFSGTVIAVAAFTAAVTCRYASTLRAGLGRKYWLAIVGLGVPTGLLAAVVSAPVVVYLFGGVTGSGSAVLVAFFLKTGSQLMNAALLSGLTAEPVDKTLQLLLAVIVYRATPDSFIQLLRGAPYQDSAASTPIDKRP